MSGRFFLQRKRMTDILFISMVAAPYVVMLVANHMIGKDMVKMAEAIKDMSLQIKVLSTHAASMDSKINSWNLSSKKNKGE